MHVMVGTYGEGLVRSQGASLGEVKVSFRCGIGASDNVRRMPYDRAAFTGASQVYGIITTQTGNAFIAGLSMVNRRVRAYFRHRVYAAQSRS